MAIPARQNEMLERFINHANDQADAMIGFSPMDPRFPPPSPVLNVGGVHLHNIHIENSVVGALNTGTVERLDVSITTLRETGEPDLAAAI